jgi:hypothetical protein
MSATPKQARAELERCAGTQLDPTIVNAALTVTDNHTAARWRPYP